MATPIDTLYHACDPLKEAGEDFYYDCSEARGRGTLRQDFLQRLSKVSGREDFVRYLFSGHPGCGKSSEIKVLQRSLEHGDAEFPHLPAYQVVYINAQEYFNEFVPVTAQEVLLTMVSELASLLREQQDIDLVDNALTERLREIWRGVTTRIGIEAVEVTLGTLKARLKPLAFDEEARFLVQEALQREPGKLLIEVNEVLDQAREKLLGKKHKRIEGILFLVDQLEKCRPAQNGDRSLYELFIDNARLLSGVRAHVLYTMPLAFIRTKFGELQAAYGQAPIVLPMVTIRTRTNVPYPIGLETLKAVLRKRLPDGLTLTGTNGVFTDEALAILLEMSGGYLRNLMIFVREACLKGNTLPFDASCMRQAIAPTMRGYSPTIPAAYWPKLAAVERDPQHQIDQADVDYQAMLEQVCVMEYANGGGEDEWAMIGMPWFGVNPILSKLPQFREAMKQLQTLASP